MGRMSRYKKIKSCDPFYKGPRKESSPTCSKLLKNDKLGEQEMPRAAKDLLKRQVAMKKKTTMNKTDRKQRKTAQLGMAKFQRIPGESNKQYFVRIDQEATVEVAEALKASRKMRDGRKKHLKDRKQKIKEKKRSLEENAGFDLTKDNVRFGDVVMQPPSLTAKPRKAPEPNKGSKSLLLHSVISQNNDTNTQSKTRDNPAIPKTKKRKHMSALEQERADKERERAIIAYRLMRKQRRQEKNETV